MDIDLQLKTSDPAPSPQSGLTLEDITGSSAEPQFQPRTREVQLEGCRRQHQCPDHARSTMRCPKNDENNTCGYGHFGLTHLSRLLLSGCLLYEARCLDGSYL